jgi:cell division protease FtsH
MGGRAAEEIIFNHFSTGASNDLQQATDWARRMVCKYGMSDKLGPVAWGDEGGDVFLGRDFVAHKDFSEKKSEEIDDEVASILRRMYVEAKQLLEDNRDTLNRIAEALLERETLETKGLDLLLRGEPLPPLESPSMEQEEASEDSAELDPAEKKKGFLGGKIPDPEPVPS